MNAEYISICDYTPFEYDQSEWLATADPRELSEVMSNNLNYSALIVYELWRTQRTTELYRAIREVPEDKKDAVLDNIIHRMKSMLLALYDEPDIPSHDQIIRDFLSTALPICFKARYGIGLEAPLGEIRPEVQTNIQGIFHALNLEVVQSYADYYREIFDQNYDIRFYRPFTLQPMIITAHELTNRLVDYTQNDKIADKMTSKMSLSIT